MMDFTSRLPVSLADMKKGRRRSRNSNTNMKALNSSSRSLLNDEYKVARFQRSDGMNGHDILSYLENHPEMMGLRCEEVLADQHIEPIHQLLVNYHTSIHLTTLELPHNGLTLDSCDALAKILGIQQETLLRLDLSKNPLTGAGVSRLVNPLISRTQPSRISNLNLSDTQLTGNKGGTAIAILLRENRSIKELSLAHNNLGAKGMKTLSSALTVNSSVQNLDLSFNNIQKRGAAVIAQALQNSTDSKLRILNIECNNLGPAGLQAFTELLATDRRIETFYVGGNVVEADGASYLGNALRYNYTLKELRLQDNKIGDVGAWMLADGLSENDHRTSSLERLYLGWNAIGLEGASSLAEALKENSRLSCIDLTGNKICCSGAEALADALSYNLTLKELILTGNQVRNPGAFAFAKAMGKPSCSLDKLSWDENYIEGEGQASLDRVPQLRRNQKHWFGQVLRDLSKGAISSVNLAERDIGNEELLLLIDILVDSSPLLRSIWLSGANLSPRSLIPFFEKALAPPCNIIRLYLRHCDCGDTVSLSLSSVLSQNKTIEILSITNSSISATGASSIAEGLQNNTVLRRLNLDGNRIGDVGVASIASALKYCSLSSLSVSRNVLTDLSMGYEDLKTLEELHMNGNMITDRGAVEFCRYLIDGCSLIWLSLRDNRLTSRGGETIKTFLPDNAVIQY